MADRAQLYNDPEEAFRLAFEGKQSTMWTAAPGIVTEVDLAKNTCSVQIAIQGSVEDENGQKQAVNLPLLADVPIIWPRAGGFALTFPLAVNDEVLVVFAARCIDAWWQSGGIQRPMEARMHDLSDGFAIPGPASQPKKLANVSSSGAQLRNEAGTTYVEISDDGKIKLVSSAGIEVDGDLTVAGKIEADEQVTAMKATVPVNLSTHVHTGVTPGGGTTGGPTG